MSKDKEDEQREGGKQTGKRLSRRIDMAMKATQNTFPEPDNNR